MKTKSFLTIIALLSVFSFKVFGEPLPPLVARPLVVTLGVHFTNDISGIDHVVAWNLPQSAPDWVAGLNSTNWVRLGTNAPATWVYFDISNCAPGSLLCASSADIYGREVRCATAAFVPSATDPLPAPAAAVITAK